MKIDLDELLSAVLNVRAEMPESLRRDGFKIRQRMQSRHQRWLDAMELRLHNLTLPRRNLRACFRAVKERMQEGRAA